MKFCANEWRKKWSKNKNETTTTETIRQTDGSTERKGKKDLFIIALT